VNTKATSVMVMAAAVKRTERMLCMIVTFLLGMWVLATPLARGPPVSSCAKVERQAQRTA